MTWEHNGYTWKSGWFLEEYPWDGDYGHYLKFSADGVTTKGYGAPGITIASNYSERHPDDSAWWDTSAGEIELETISLLILMKNQL